MQTSVNTRKGFLDFLECMMPGHSDLRKDFLAALAAGDSHELHCWFMARNFYVTEEEARILIANRDAAARKAETCAWY
jgi:hypothetical protein